MINPGLVQSSIRTSRVSGPNGHAGGKQWKVIQSMAISPYHENAVPRNYQAANIVLPLQCKKTSLIVGALPLYMGVEEKGAAAAPKRGIPQYGFHVIPRRAPMIPLCNPPEPKKSTKSKEKTTTVNVSENVKTAGKMMNQELTLTRFNGARLLKRLVTERPDLATSTKAVEWMLEKEKCVRARLEGEHGQWNAPDFIDDLGKTDNTFSFALNYAHMDRYPSKQKDDQDTVV